MKTLLLFTFFLSQIAYAIDGIVVVHLAPVFDRPSASSRIIQKVRRGHKLYINEKYRNQPMRKLNAYSNPNDWQEEDFYQTIDKTGNLAYVPKDFVKLATNEGNEAAQSIRPWTNDPTDYRIAEPIPKKYPFYHREKTMASIRFRMGSSKINSSYNFGGNYEKTQSSFRVAGEFTFLRSIKDDATQRFFYGFHAGGSTARNLFKINKTDAAQEDFIQYSIGPLINYQLYRDDKQFISTTGGVTLNYIRSLVRVEEPLANEERFFSGLAPSVRIGLSYSRFTPFENIYFNFGLTTEFTFQHQLTSDTPVISKYWTTDSQIIPFGTSVTGFFGIQGLY